MKSKPLILILFFLMAALQLYVPAQMILDREEVLKTGKEFRFKTRPIDPNDPFRGKYITLYFQDNFFLLDSAYEWDNPDEFYVMIEEDQDAYAQIIGVSVEKPKETRDYFLAKSSSTMYDENGIKLWVDFPFNKFFMEESKAYEAEKIVREANVDSLQTAYALVAVKEGESVLKNVFIDGIPIKDVVQERMK